MTKIPLFLTWSDAPPVVVTVSESQALADAWSAGFKFGRHPHDEFDVMSGELVTLDAILNDPVEHGVPVPAGVGEEPQGPNAEFNKAAFGP